jgi:hypothetical protein
MYSVQSFASLAIKSISELNDNNTKSPVNIPLSPNTISQVKVSPSITSSSIQPIIVETLPKPERKLVPARRLTSKKLIEKVVEKTFGAENKDVIFQKYQLLQEINTNTGDVKIARGNEVLREENIQESNQKKTTKRPINTRKNSRAFGGLPMPVA